MTGYIPDGIDMPGFETLIEVDDTRALLAGDGCRVVDCRFDLLQPDKGRQEYLEGHIPGAAYAHLDDDLAAPTGAHTGRHPLPDPAEFAATLGGWGISDASQVVVYDHASGAIAARLWWMLRWLGHRRAAVLNGGIGAWTGAGGALETGEPEIEAATYSGKADNSLVITTEELAAAVSAGEPINLYDARDLPRFRGDREPIDPVAGHVPGARSFPFSRNITADGRWLEPAELEQRWTEAFGGATPARWATMCGSGVTACHLVLSAQIAGLHEPGLYVGSWSEWIRDAARPVATGDEPSG